MESSSDNFAWSSASSDNGADSDAITVAMKSDVRDSPESDKNYKKKLHKKLHLKDTEEELKQELLDDGRVKHEADSDSEGQPKRKRKKESVHGSSEFSPSHDSYLKSRVKQEQNSVAHEENSNLNVDEIHSETLQQSADNESDKSTRTPKRKKVKRKSKRKSEAEDHSEDIKDIFCAEETIIQSHTSKQNSNETQEDETSEKEKVHKIKKQKKKKSEVDIVNNSEEENTLVIPTNSNSYVNNTDHESNDDRRDLLKRNSESDLLVNSFISDDHRKTKIADTILFEDDDSILSHNETQEYNDVPQSSRLGRFLKAHPQLQVINGKPNREFIMSSDDDIWLVTCPSEIDIKLLKNKDLSLDGKCKIKSEGTTYIGNVEKNISHMTVLTFNHKKPLIKNIELCGTINLHKKLPKTHLMEDNIMQNNQTDFIPLPDTKCRHPLFGADYKKAIKIPSAVKARLQAQEMNSIVSPSENKKKRKHKVALNDVVDGVCDNNAGESRAAGRKRHASPEQHTPAPKRKRVKRELAADTWDSEKAIEQNLFNI